MGAHLSTVHAQLQEQFKKRDQGKKGYLILKEVMAISPLYGVNPQHIGVLYQVDKNHDGVFALDELLTFASFVHSYAKANHALDSSYMTAGLCSMRMWKDLRDDRGRAQFVDWAMKLFMEGYELVQLEGRDDLYVHRKALKAMHTLFDMERNVGVDYQGLRDMMQSAAEEQQLLNPEIPEHDDWVPIEVLRLFTEALADGMSGIMESFFSDDAEIVLDGVEAGVAAVTEAALAAQSALLADNNGGGSSSRGNTTRQKCGSRSSRSKSTLGRTPHPPAEPMPSSTNGGSRRPTLMTPLKLPMKPLEV